MSINLKKFAHISSFNIFCWFFSIQRRWSIKFMNHGQLCHEHTTERKNRNNYLYKEEKRLMKIRVVLKENCVIQ